MSVLSIKVPTRKKCGNLSYAPRIGHHAFPMCKGVRDYKLLRGVMVIVVGIGHDDTSSNHGRN